jgi:hypothetical protein
MSGSAYFRRLSERQELAQDAAASQVGMLGDIRTFAAAARAVSDAGVGTLSREEAASLAGLAPLDRQSGGKDGQRHIQGGYYRVAISITSTPFTHLLLSRCGAKRNHETRRMSGTALWKATPIVQAWCVSRGSPRGEPRHEEVVFCTHRGMRHQPCPNLNIVQLNMNIVQKGKNRHDHPIVTP